MSDQLKMKMPANATLQDYMRTSQVAEAMGLEPKHTGINSFGNVVNTKPADLHANLDPDLEVHDNDAGLLKKALAENKKLKEDNENLRLQLTDQAMTFDGQKLEPATKIKLTPEVVEHLNKIKESYVAPQESNVIDPGEYKHPKYGFDLKYEPEVKEEAKPKPTFAKLVKTDDTETAN